MTIYRIIYSAVLDRIKTRDEPELSTPFRTVAANIAVTASGFPQKVSMPIVRWADEDLVFVRITTDELEDIESDPYRIPILDLVNAFAVLMKTAALRSSDDFISEIDLGIESGFSLTLKAQKIGNHPWDRG